MSNQQVNHSNIQTGTHQQSSSTQHCDTLHGDSSEVTDQTSSQWTPHPIQGLPYHHGNQQQLQDGAPSPINPQSNTVPHQHIPPSDRTLPLSQTLFCPSDETQTSIQQSRGNSSLSADSQFTQNPLRNFRTAYQQRMPSSPQDLPQEPANQTNMYTLHHTQGMIHSGGSANSVNVTMRTVASQPASPFPETAEQISSQPRLFLHPQASQHISQTGALQQRSSTHGMPHGDSSVVTDQTNSPYPHRVLLCRPPYHCTNQQHLQRRWISYLQAMPNSRQHTFPCNGSDLPQSLIQHLDYSPNLTTGHYFQGSPRPHHNQPPLPHNPHQVQPYRPPPHQTNRQSAPNYPLLHSQPTPHQGVTPQPISPHGLGYSHSPALNTPYLTPRYHHQQPDGNHFREHSQMYLLHYTHNTSSITHLGLPTPLVKPYFSSQSGYAHVNSPAQQSLMNQPTSNQKLANLVSVEPTKPHSPSTSQPTTLSANRTDSTASSSSMSLDAPDPKRARLSPHSSTTPRVLEVGLSEPYMTSLSTGRSYISCDNSLPSSSQNHSFNEHLDTSPSNSSPPKPTFNIVYGKLIPICSEWHNFGLALGLTQTKLKEIDSDNKMCKNCLRETLSVRINEKPLTCRDVVNAFRRNIVKNNELAENIECEFSEQLDVQIQWDDPADQEQGFHNITLSAINIPNCVVRYASYLKDRYNRMPVLPDTWPPPLDGKDHFKI